MSAETRAALDDALEAHLRDESDDGAMITGYIMYAAFITAEIENGLTFYRCITPAGQPYHSTLGLAHSMIADMDAPVRVEDD